MSDQILRALMQLFAIIARVDINPSDENKNSVESSEGKKIIKLILSQELNQSLIDEYLEIFDSYLEKHQGIKKRKDGAQKRTSLNSVKILRICSEINKELQQIQKIIVLIRLMEFVQTNDAIKEQEIEFISTVAEAFNISKKEYDILYQFSEGNSETVFDVENVLYVLPEYSSRWKLAKQIPNKGINGLLAILRVESVNAFFIKYLGKDQITLNGQIIPIDRQHIFKPGSSIRTAKSKPIYYSDVISKFLSNESSEKLLFKCEDVSYKFRNNKIGLHNISFEENSGALIGMMGGSGAGKSTLLNVLNGNLTPSSGQVTINGIDIHHQSKEVEGIIGFISQDDLLIEELTVYENLFYNAQLCFRDLSIEEVEKKVIQLLKDIGLFNARELKVGNSLSKTISGGQRKRLNIALELIREPQVLFVDEPTSGLSSRDSENIMDLLNELTLRGKLIFVVIHQPSSDIFKMFDRLMLLDQGGYPIFYGDPIDSVVYFKRRGHHANSEQRECSECGNVNPEQIFKIIEANVLDEYGNPTSKRKKTPEEWFKSFLENKPPQHSIDEIKDPPKASNKIPNRLKQFRVFFKRDVLAKMANRQYILINGLEAPVLALVLGFFVKYFGVNNNSTYTFEASENIPQFLFIAVIVALFLGLTVAAEEIIKDQKILKRETFLNLSKGTYLLSKITIMFIISAIQTALFVLIGNLVLEIHGMWLYYWLILFSISCFANLLGLNISATFDSAKVIYILIPIMIIPQLLFSGVIVKFDKLHPWFSQEDSVPWIGDVMASRWAYEALAVSQFKQNAYEELFYPVHQQKSESSWKRDYWLSELKNLQNIYSNYRNDTSKTELVKNARLTLIHEITKEEELYDPSQNFVCEGCVEALKENSWSAQVNTNMTRYFSTLREIYNREVKRSMQANVHLIKKLGTAKVKLLKRNHFNESLSDFVTRRNDLDKIINIHHKLIQKADPIYKIPHNKSFFDSQFYAPFKNFFGNLIPTILANIIVLWGMTILLVITLYYDFFRKFINAISNIPNLFKKS